MSRLIALMIVVAYSATPLWAQEEWEMFGPFRDNRAWPAVVKISPWKGIIAGGWSGQSFTTPVATTEILEIENGVIVHRDGPRMPVARAEFPLVRMNDSILVAVGGFNGGGVHKSIDVYNDNTETWTKIGNLIYGRRQHIAYPMNDSMILVTGGRHADLSTMAYTELVNIHTGESRLVKEFPVIVNGGIGGLTSRGTGVACGGRAGGPNSARVREIFTYDLVSDKWLQVGQMATGREAPMPYELERGGFVIAGGSYQEEPAVFSGEVMLEYDDKFELLGTVPTGVVYCGVTEYRVNELLIIGGWKSNLSSNNETWFVDAASGAVVRGPNLIKARRYTRGLTLEDHNGGRYSFAIGGFSSNGTPNYDIEVLRPYTIEPCVGSYVDLIKNSDQVTTVGTASRGSSWIDLNQNVPFATGGAWYKEKINFTETFETSFAFRLHDGTDNELKDDGPAGADGISLILQNVAPTVLGDPGNGIGYDKIPHGLVVEFDSYLNAAYSDPTTSHVAVQTGDGFKTRAVHAAPYLQAIEYERVPSFVADGSTYYAKVEYRDEHLKVWISKSSDLGDPIIDLPIRITDIINPKDAGTAWIGLNAATGFAQERHEIVAWTVGSCDSQVSSVHEQNQSEDQLHIVPNPVNSQLTFALGESSVSPCSVKVVDMRGITVRSVDLPSGNNALNVSDLVPGAYILVVSNDQGMFSGLFNIVH